MKYKWSSCKNFLTSLASAFHIDCRILTLIFPRRKFSGMCSGWNSNSKPTESASLNRCRRWLAALARFTGFGKLGQGSSVCSSISTSLTTADSGLNKFATASFFCPFSNPGCWACAHLPRVIVRRGSQDKFTWRPLNYRNSTDITLWRT